MVDTKVTSRLSSVERALTLMEVLAAHSGLTITQLATRMGTGKATAFRLAGTLVERGWLVKDDELRYRLGPGILGLAAARQEVDLAPVLRPILEELHEACGETIHLTRLDGRQIIYLDQLISPQPVHSVAVLGSRSPAHCVSPGLAQLALLPDEMLNWVLAVALRRYTDHSPRTADEVRAQLEVVRDRGYAVNVGAYRPDVGGVGVAVSDSRGMPIAGISVCMPTYRMKTMDLEALGDRLTGASNDARHRLQLAQGN
ncbi:IclR family transcriptional regulator [Streptomyces chartreusis]|uniref:IclR family transcriptional regulator n=1 Tax=Streptomyces chartreusis TaxID=1969 RepID=UPI0036252EFF